MHAWACFCAFLPNTAPNLHQEVVTWSGPRTKILPAASRGQWLTQHDFSWLPFLCSFPLWAFRSLPVLCRVLWNFCGFVFLSVSCRFPKFFWIVLVSIGFLIFHTGLRLQQFSYSMAKISTILDPEAGSWTAQKMNSNLPSLPEIMEGNRRKVKRRGHQSGSHVAVKIFRI